MNSYGNTPVKTESNSNEINPADTKNSSQSNTQESYTPTALHSFNFFAHAPCGDFLPDMATVLERLADVKEFSSPAITDFEVKLEHEENTELDPAVIKLQAITDRSELDSSYNDLLTPLQLRENATPEWMNNPNNFAALIRLGSDPDLDSNADFGISFLFRCYFKYGQSHRGHPNHRVKRGEGEEWTDVIIGKQKVLSLVKKLDDDFINEYGKKILFNSLNTIHFELVKYLVIDKKVSTSNINIKDLLHALDNELCHPDILRQAEAGDIIDLFLLTGMQIISEKNNSPLSMRSRAKEHLMQRGLNPLTCRISYSQGDAFLSACQSKENNTRALLRFGAGLSSVRWGKEHCEKMSDYVKAYATEFPAEKMILFPKSYFTDDMIFNVSDLKAILNQLCENHSTSTEGNTLLDRLRIEIVCYNVLTTGHTNLVPGVLDAFKQYKKSQLNYIYSPIYSFFQNKNVTNFIMGYIESEEVMSALSSETDDIKSENATIQSQI